MRYLGGVAVGRAVLTAGIVLFLVATLTPSGDHTHGFSFCLFCAPRASADALANVVLLLPVGAALGLLGHGWWVAVLAGGMLSVTLEVAQLAIPGRDPNLSDVLSNSAGAAIGALLAVRLRSWLAPPDAAADRLALVAAGAACTVWAVTGLMLAPSFPPTTYWGQWTPRLVSLGSYDGRVLDAAVGDLTVTDAPVPRSDELRARLMAREPVTLSIIAGPPPSRPSSIFSIADKDARRVLLVGAVGDDVILRYRTRAADWRLDQPDLRVPGALAGVVSGERLEVHVRREGGAYCLRVGAFERCGIDHGVGDGWALLAGATAIPAVGRTILQTAWVFVLVVPVGFWSGPRKRWFAAAACVAAGLVVIPPATDLLAARWHEWAAAVTGIAAGRGLGLLSRRMMCEVGRATSQEADVPGAEGLASLHMSRARREVARRESAE